MTDHGCTIGGQPAMPILISEYNHLVTRLAETEALLRRYVDLADVTHKYRAMGGHDSLGENLGCAGCTLRDQARTTLNRPEPTP